MTWPTLEPERVIGEILPWLEEIGAEPFLWGGTLLGWYRDTAFIPWDTDVDIGVPAERFPPTADLTPPPGWVIRLEFPVEPWMAPHGVRRGNLKLVRDGQRVGIHVMHGSRPGWRAFTFHKDLAQVPETSPRGWHAGLPVPADPVASLAWYYGDDWRTPDPLYHRGHRYKARKQAYLLKRP